MSKLNPCPICGCSVRVWAKRFDEEDMEYIIECDNDFCGLTYGISCGYNRDEIKKAWNSVTALSPKVNEDCISRADLIESFLADNECKREEAKACMCSLDLMLELIEDAPSVTPTVSEDCDCISKHDIWKIIEDNAYWVRYNENSTEKGMTLTGINQALNECASVTPTERTGEWIENAPEGQGIDPPYICSICGHAESTRTPFCEQCGAKMKGGTENE